MELHLVIYTSSLRPAGYLCPSRMRATCCGRMAAGSAVLDVIVEDYICDFACRCGDTGKPHPDADSLRQGYRGYTSDAFLGQLCSTVLPHSGAQGCADSGKVLVSI